MPLTHFSKAAQKIVTFVTISVRYNQKTDQIRFRFTNKGEPHERIRFF